MKTPIEEHISQEAYDAACRDRDKWADLAMEQLQYIRRLEQQVQTLQKQMQTMSETKKEQPIIENYGTLTYIAEQNNDIHDNEHVYVGSEGKNELTSERVSERKKNFFCRITDEAYEKDRAKAVEEGLRRACISAPKLIAAIRTNEALGYLDTQNISSAELYKLLDEHFHLPFQLHNFTKYRSKINNAI